VVQQIVLAAGGGKGLANCHELLQATGYRQGLNDPNAQKREDWATIRLTWNRGVGGSRKGAKQGLEIASKVRKMEAL